MPPNITSRPAPKLKNLPSAFQKPPFSIRKTTLFTISRFPIKNEKKAATGHPKPPKCSLKAHKGLPKSSQGPPRDPKIEPRTSPRTTQEHTMPPRCLPRGSQTFQDTKKGAMRVLFGHLSAPNSDLLASFWGLAAGALAPSDI